MRNKETQARILRSACRKASKESRGRLCAA